METDKEYTDKLVDAVDRVVPGSRGPASEVLDWDGAAGTARRLKLLERVSEVKTFRKPLSDAARADLLHVFLGCKQEVEKRYGPRLGADAVRSLLDCMAAPVVMHLASVDSRDGE